MSLTFINCVSSLYQHYLLDNIISGLCFSVQKGVPPPPRYNFYSISWISWIYVKVSWKSQPYHYLHVYYYINLWGWLINIHLYYIEVPYSSILIFCSVTKEFGTSVFIQVLALRKRFYLCKKSIITGYILIFVFCNLL